MRTGLLFLVATLPSTAWSVPDACDGFSSLAHPSTSETAETALLGSFRYSGFGASIAVADYNGDGNTDYAIGAPFERTNGLRAGAVFIFFGPHAPEGPRDASTADVVLTAPSPYLRAGWHLHAPGDVDADGRDDLLIGSNAESGSMEPDGVAWLVSPGTLAGTVELSSVAAATFRGDAALGGFGAAVGSVGDLDGDGVVDLVIGAPRASEVAPRAGAAFLFHGPFLGDTTHDARIDGVSARAEFGSAVVGLGDLDGDGRGEVAITAPGDRSEGVNSGAVHVFRGAASWPASMDVSGADGTFTGRSSSFAGRAMTAAGDVDADGLIDLWIAAPRWGAGRAGRAWLLSGADLLGAGEIADHATATFTGAGASREFGSSLAIGDLDGDGTTDLVAGAPGAERGASRPGAAWALHGPFEGTTAVDPADGQMVGLVDRGLHGWAVAVGDLNGDGFDDVLIGAPKATAAGRRSAGVVSIHFGGADLVDEQSWYADTDADGWGDDGAVTIACEAPPSHVLLAGDCDDADGAYHPYAIEADCSDPRDLNCDGSVGPVDGDGDGVDACAGDCHDGRADVSPAATERCADGIDNNCDGLTDDASAVDALTWAPDVDGDGYGSSAFSILSCEDPGVFVGAVVNVAGDCNDLAASVNPAALERCDNVDNDCDAFTDEPDAIDAVAFHPDVDGDGSGDHYSPVIACSAPAGHVSNNDDCDDSLAEVRPGATETCNELDDDCDGMAYLGGPVDPPSHLDATGDGQAARFGGTLATIPDMNGDGRDELLVGAPNDATAGLNSGAVYLLHGTEHIQNLDLSTRRIDGSGWWAARAVSPWRGARLGTSMIGGDFNGDGIGDIAVGAPQFANRGIRGGVVVWFGPVSGELDLTAADVLLEGASTGSLTGAELASGDVDGDGFDDLLVSAPSEHAGGDRRGAVYLLHGGEAWSTGDISASADAVFVGSDRDELGSAIAVAGDLDGDGHVDLALGASTHGALQTGYVSIQNGGATRFSGVMSVTDTLRGYRSNLQLGTSLAAVGDADGDGIDDLSIGSNFNEAWLVYGPVTPGRVDLTRGTKLTGPGSDGVGNQTTTVGDVDADGLADWLVSAHDLDLPHSDAGGAYLVYGGDHPDSLEGEDLESFGRLEGGTTWSAANTGGPRGARIRGRAQGERLGRAVAAGDFDGDGNIDLAFGAPDQGPGHIRVVRTSPYGLDHTATPSAALDDSKTAWVHDRDTDGQGTDTLEGFDACPMHIPIDLSDPADPRPMAVSDPTLYTDCDDSDASVYLGAPEVDDDGIDRDCDGYDNINKLPLIDLDLAAVTTLETAEAEWELTDPDAGTPGETPIVFTWTWRVDGTEVVPESDTTLDGVVHFDRGQTVELEVVADDGRDVAPAVTASFVVPNARPVIDAVTAGPVPVNDAETLTGAVGTASDDDGDVIDTACIWQRQELDGTWTDLFGQTSLTLGPCMQDPICDFHDTVRLTCTPDDGIELGDPVSSAPVFIERSNVAPEASLCAIAEYDSEDLLALAAASDEDGDTISWDFTWMLTTSSGTQTVQGGPLLSHSWFDATPTTVVLTCTPKDYLDAGEPLQSAPYVHALDGDDGDARSECRWQLAASGGGIDEVAYGVFDAVAGWTYQEGEAGSLVPGPVDVDVSYGPSKVDLWDLGDDGIGGTSWSVIDTSTGLTLAAGVLGDKSLLSTTLACEGTAPFDTADTDVPDCTP